jgi:hypothetical protein
MSTTCGTCNHWLPRETPRWAVREGMAVCALKRTKAVTTAHWHACPKHQPIEGSRADARAVFVAKLKNSTESK